MSDDDTAREANATIQQAKVACEDRGEEFRPRHVYVDGSGQCQCKRGPDLSERRMK